MYKVTLKIERSNGKTIYSTMNVNAAKGDRSMGYIVGHLQGLIDQGHSVEII